jgi:hypothetical protein
MLLAFGAVGVVAARRQPRNAVAWLLIGVAVVAMFEIVANLYLVLDYRRHHGDLPLGPVFVYWVGGYTLLPILFGMPAILLFPNGRTPSKRWRRVLQAYLALATLFMLAQFAGWESVSVGRHFQIDIRGNTPNDAPLASVAGFAWALTPLFLLCWLGFVGHQLRAWRHSTGEQRAQLKWLISGGAICVLSCVTLVVFGDGSSGTARVAADLSTAGIAALPISIGVGILRYRLYEIDRLISRTLSYAILTGLLVGVFVGIIALATDVLPFSSPVAVAASTLAAAALFNPLRRRVQHAVDRRFNRSRYDAEEIVTAFTARLRDAVDLDTVRQELLRAVDGAVQPAHASVWLRPTAQRSRA